jgi:hypothetical protein
MEASMKKIILLLLLLMLTKPTLGQTKPQPETKPLAFTHVTVIDATGAPAKSDMTVVIIGDRISAISKTGKVSVPDGAQVVDATGKFLIPGLWDMHAHGLEQVFPLLIANGITGIRYMGAARQPWVEHIARLRGEIAAGTLSGPRIAAIGPLIDGSKLLRPAVATVATNAEEARQAVIKGKTSGDFVKILDTLPREAFFAVADESRKQRIPFLGHMPVYVNAGEASDAGMKSIEHFSGVLVAASTRESELRKQLIAAVSAPPTDPAEPNGSRAPTILYRPNASQIATLLDSYSQAKATDLIARFRKNGTWQCPTLIYWKLFAMTDEFARDPRMRYVPATQRNTWQGDRRASHVPEEEAPARKRLLEKYLKLAGEARKSGVRFLAGSDFGVPNIIPGFSLHNELALFVEAGFTAMEALQTATINPAKFLGILDSLGTVEKGKLADLVLLEANPLEDIHNTQKINAVVVNGRLTLKSELQAMLASVEAEANKK